MQSNERIEVTRLELRQWGLWARGDGTGCLDLKRRGDDCEAFDITDERARVIDSAVGAVLVQSPHLGAVLKLAYVRGLGILQIAAKLRVSRNTASAYLARGESDVDALLFNK